MESRRSLDGPAVTFRTRLLYGIGDMSNAIKMVLAATFGFYFYTSVMGLSGSLVALAGAIGLLWDALIDPYIGYLSDRARFRFGKRHSFMLVGALIMGVGFWLSFSPPRHLSSIGLFAWLLGTGFVARAAASMFRVPYLALGAELSPDYHERARITATRSFMSFIGVLAAASLSFVLFFPNTEPGVDPKLNYSSYPAMGLVFGAVMTGVSLIATVGTLSHRLSTPEAASQVEFPLSWSSLSIYAQCFHNRAFRMLFASVVFFFLGVTINTILAVHFLTYYVDIRSSVALSLFQLIFYLSAMVGVGVWLRLLKRLDKHRVYLISVSTTSLLFLGAFGLLGEGHLLSTGNVYVLAIMHALLGFFNSIVWFVPASLLADIVDADELTHGQRRDGVFFGLFSAGEQLASGLAVLLAGILVDWFAGLVPGQDNQSSTTIWRIGCVYGFLPAMLLAIGALMIIRYPLDRQRQIAIRAELDRRCSPCQS